MPASSPEPAAADRPELSENRPPWKRGKWILLAIAIAAIVATADPAVKLWQAWYRALDATVQFALDLLGIGAIALLFAALLSPLETLGWWAGWYGDGVEAPPTQFSRGDAPQTPSAATAAAIAPDSPPPPLASPVRETAPEKDRYLVYLDGISQSNDRYLPEVEVFLTRLQRNLPDSVVLIRGVMAYSPMDRALTENRPLARFWRWVERSRAKPKRSPVERVLGLFVNVRNMFAVAISADSRYGPLYNRGTAQAIFERLVERGYAPSSGVPVTLIGFSGGGQIAMGAAPFLRQALQGPIDIISLAGVIAGGNDALAIEHLYHLVGDRDPVERVGAVMSPRRWSAIAFSPWNRAKRRGKIDIISLGPVGHQVPGGLMDARAHLPDGRSHLDQTLQWVTDLVLERRAIARWPQRRTPSNYDRYRQNRAYQSARFPLDAPLPDGTRPLVPGQRRQSPHYRPVGDWLGRPILPDGPARSRLRGIAFEVHRAPEPYANLTGQRVVLRWRADLPEARDYLRATVRDVHFSPAAAESARSGKVHPERLNHWRQVQPLESLAGSHPEDDLLVQLVGPVSLSPLSPPLVLGERNGSAEASWNGAGASLQGARFGRAPLDRWEFTTAIAIEQEPVQVTGRYCALVRFLGPVEAEEVGPGATPGDSPPETLSPISCGDASRTETLCERDRWRAVHFNRETRAFDGPAVVLEIPETVPNRNDIYPSVRAGLERSPANADGWYVYGAPDSSGMFSVQAIAPRALLRVQPERVVSGFEPARHYLKQGAWADTPARKGQFSSVLLDSRRSRPETRAIGEATGGTMGALDRWREGDRALVLHVYGGVGGKKIEPAARGPVYFGHFAYGTATVVRDPLADELRFDIVYHQIYTHNGDGLVAGNLHWSRYLGDRQFGFLGMRPTCDLLVKLEAFSEPFDFDGWRRSALDLARRQFEAMTARYRIGDGTGGTYVGPANNCAQDSNQALYAALCQIEAMATTHRDYLADWQARSPQEAQRLRQLFALQRSLKRQLAGLGGPRRDWAENVYNLGIALEDRPLRNLSRGLKSWRTMLPRLASDTVALQFLRQGAAIWVLRTNQVGGWDPDIEPLAPTTL